MPLPLLKQQEIPFDHPQSTYMFLPTTEKPLLATPMAIQAYQIETVLACLRVLQEKAEEHVGLDYLQVFEDASKEENLWFIEDEQAITALLPSDY